MTSPQIPEGPAGQQPQQPQPQQPQPQQPQQNQYAAPQYAAPQQTAQQQPAPIQRTNTLAVVGLVAAFIAAPVGAVLSFIALKQIKTTGEEGRGLALAGAIVGSVLTGLAVVYIIVMVLLFALALNAGDPGARFDNSDSTSTETQTDSGTSSDSYSGSGSSNLPESTRDNPLPLNTPIETDEWSIVVNSVDLDATAEVAAENEYNDTAPEGSVFVLINVTAKYTGNNSQGEPPTFRVEYVSKAGNSFDEHSGDTYVLYPDRFPLGQNLYEGASSTGNILLTLPKEGLTEGVLAVSPDYTGEKVFLALQ